MTLVRIVLTDYCGDLKEMEAEYELKLTAKEHQEQRLQNMLHNMANNQNTVDECHQKINKLENVNTKIMYAEEDIASIRTKIDTIDKKIDSLRSEQNTIDAKTKDILNRLTSGEAKLNRE